MPSNLLIARKRKNRINPVFAKLNSENLEVAEHLIQIYVDNDRRKRGEIKELITELEDRGHDYRYVRGLSSLLDRRCIFRTSVESNPVLVRQKIFQTAQEMGFPTTDKERKQVMRRVATELAVTVKELEESLYADLEDEQILENFTPIKPNLLLKNYNLSLTQTLLFQSIELQFSVSGNWQNIFRSVKWLGLIYDFWETDDQLWIKVDGPMSLFKLNRRYGTSLAKLLPSIIANRNWRLKAKILRQKDHIILDLELDSRKNGQLFESVIPTETYDSQVEENFALRFNALNTGWQLNREPIPLSAGRFVMIPDFCFKKEGIDVYMEVVGFWTKDYLKHKLKKLETVKDVDIILAVDKALACQRMDKIGERQDVIYYKRKIPVKPVLSHLKTLENKLVTQQIQLLKKTSFKLVEPVLDIGELAKSLGVIKNALWTFLNDNPLSGYLTLTNIIVKRSKLKEIDVKLRQQLNKRPLRLEEASEIIEELGGRNPTSILKAIGYQTKWHGIDPKSAIVEKISNTKEHD